MTGDFWRGHNLESIASRLRHLPRRVIRLEPNERSAGVLLPLCRVKGVPSVLFTKRGDDVPTHKGHVSFPGGMREPMDETIEATALRETEEEVGIPGREVQVLGLCHDVRAITGVPVTPVIGWLGTIDHPEDLPFDRREIASIFSLTLEQIMDPDSRKLVHYDPRGSYPVFESGPWPVWGLTAYMLREFLEEILLQDLWPKI